MATVTLLFNILNFSNFTGANAVLTTMQQILADAAELASGRPESHSLADLLGLCLVALAFASELSISKGPAGIAAMASRLADSLSDAILKVCRLPILASCFYHTSSCPFKHKLYLQANFSAALDSIYDMLAGNSCMHLSAAYLLHAGAG